MDEYSAFISVDNITDRLKKKKPAAANRSGIQNTSAHTYSVNRETAIMRKDSGEAAIRNSAQNNTSALMKECKR